MDLDALPPPVLVSDGRGLEALLGALERCDVVAVDTEADSFFNFREKVCLLQLTAGGRDYLVDPLAGLDLAPLGQMFADGKKQKVFHDGEYDILILKRDWGFAFRNLFDTRIAEAALGVESPGLAAVLRTRFGVELDESMQRSNWSMRPLTERQIRYARLDTHFLIALMVEQRRELDARGRAMIVEGECERLERLVPSSGEFNPDDFVRIKGARALDRTSQQRLRELFAARQRLAQAADLPPFKVLGNDALIEIALRAPRSEGELANVPGVSPKQARRLADELLGALRRAAELGPLQRSPNPSRRDGAVQLDEFEYELHERLKEWRKVRAQSLGIDSSLVLNRHVLARLAQQRPVDREHLGRVDGLLDWQVRMFGDDLLEVVRRGVREIPLLPQGQGRRRRRSRPEGEGG
jgi:ribonuclease D